MDFHAQHPEGFFSTLQFPSSLLARGPPDEPMQQQFEDCAFADLPDEQELVCHSSGKYGQFNKQDRLEMVRLSLAEIEAWQKDIAVIEGLGCIYKFTHEDRESKKEKTQIAVGIVKRVHECPDTHAMLYDIRFCPPVGAKAAKGKRPDTLYQDIASDFRFQLNYKTRAGNRVEDEDNNLPRSVMLAFNLQLNKDGRFCKVRMGDSRYNVSSYELAQNVISGFYRANAASGAV